MGPSGYTTLAPEWCVGDSTERATATQTISVINRRLKRDEQAVASEAERTVLVCPVFLATEGQ